MSSSTRWSRADAAPPAGSLLRRSAALLVVPLLAAIGCALSNFAHAAIVEAPEHVRRYIDNPRPSGTGRLTWFGLHVYDARMFVPREFDPSKPEARPFALEITYARSLAGRAIAERSRDEIAQLGFGSTAQRDRWLVEMSGLFPDVKPGQRLVGIYRPGGPTRFYVDGRFLGEVVDPEFGRAFFAIWLDPRTSVPQLRASLLSEAHR